MLCRNVRLFNPQRPFFMCVSVCTITWTSDHSRTCQIIYEFSFLQICFCYSVSFGYFFCFCFCCMRWVAVAAATSSSSKKTRVNWCQEYGWSETSNLNYGDVIKFLLISERVLAIKREIKIRYVVFHIHFVSGGKRQNRQEEVEKATTKLCVCVSRGRRRGEGKKRKRKKESNTKQNHNKEK